MVVEIVKSSRTGAPTQSQIELLAVSVFKLKRRSLFRYIHVRRAAELLEMPQAELEKKLYTKTRKLHGIKLTSGNLVLHPDSFTEYFKKFMQEKISRVLSRDHIFKGA